MLQVYAERPKIAEGNSCKSLEWNSRLTNEFDSVNSAEGTICTVFQRWIHLEKVFSITKLYELDQCGLGFKKQFSDQNYSADVTDYLGPMLNTKKDAGGVTYYWQIQCEEIHILDVDRRLAEI